MNLQARLEKLERARRAPVADPGDPSDTLLMLSDDEARHLAAELTALVAGEHAENVDYETAAAPLRKRMAYLRERRGATDGSGK